MIENKSSFLVSV